MGIASLRSQFPYALQSFSSSTFEGPGNDTDGPTRRGEDDSVCVGYDLQVRD